ncbi:MAG: hypothetical protein ACM3ZU_08155 [Bacteroidota bacterium]
MATIRVSFAELRTTGHYSNMRAEASIEVESQDPEKDFPALWERMRNEVRGQLDAEEQQRHEELVAAVGRSIRCRRGDDNAASDDDSIDEDDLDEDDGEDLPY